MKLHTFVYEISNSVKVVQEETVRAIEENRKGIEELRKELQIFMRQQKEHQQTEKKDSGEKVRLARSRSAGMRRGESKYGSTPTHENRKSITGTDPERRR